MTRNDLFETLKDLQWSTKTRGPGGDPFDRIDSKAKAAFTRAYNQASHRGQALGGLREVGGKGKGKKRKAGAVEDDEPAEELDGETVDDDEEEEEEDLSAFAKKKGRGGKAKGGAKGGAKKAAAKKKAPAKRKRN
uniref:DNA replication factor RFC1 C-terminal domain-containing protein n=1 Tax=Phaeomonas parva TaxID=124430 RepID=A0A7S1U3I1_9STRA